jgi:ribosomal protein L29
MASGAAAGEAAISRREQADDLRNQLVELETQKALGELQRQAEIGNSAVRRQIAGDNLNMAQERRRREDNARAAEQRMDDAELRENEGSAIITERMGSRRGAPMEYRGMTVDEQKDVIAEQSSQMDRNQARQRDEREKDEQWRQYQDHIRAQGDLAEAQWRRRTAEEQQDLYRTHLQQQAEFQERERRMNRDVYGTNVPDDSYYDQWGHSIR